MSRKKIGIGLLILLTLATLIFIFYRSSLSIPDSRAESIAVGQWLTPFLEIFLGRGNVTVHLIRKLAHFCEFGLLGVELMSLSLLCACRNPLYALFFALLCALSDETIQIFSERGSQVSDVWLDFSGAVCGILGILLLVILFRKVLHRRTLPQR